MNTASTDNTTPLLVLVDGSALAYRSYFAFIRNPLINSRGENTSAVFGFTNSLLKLLDQFAPSHIACIFDTPAPTFRHQIYAEYKTTRAKMPDELAESLPWIKDIVTALSIAVIERDGVEADDVIGTLARQAKKAGFRVIIFTGDKDYYQLVDNQVAVLHPKTFELFDPAAVERKYGVGPEKMVDLLALMGDASDNIPGIPGVGEKTATELLRQFGDLESVLRSPDKIKKKSIALAVANNAHLAQLARQLVTINCDVDIDFRPSDLQVKKPDTRRLIELLKRFELRTLISRFAADKETETVVVSTAVAEPQYETVTRLHQLSEILAAFEAKGECAVDTETTALDPLKAEIVGVALAAEPGRAYYLPLGHTDGSLNLPLAETLERLKAFFATKVKLIGHNLKFDRQIFRNYQIDIDPVYFDTMIASYVINPGRRTHNLAALAEDLLSYRMQPISDLIGSGPKQRSFSTVPVDKATFYAAEDADIAYRLKQHFLPELQRQKLDQLFFDLEMPLLPVLGDMEAVGVVIDVGFLNQLSHAYGQKMAAIEEKIYAEAGERFNINSPIQLRRILFEKLMLASGRKTAKTGARSTEMIVLEKLARIHPLPKLILDYRQLAKLKSTYIDALPKLVNSRTGRVHTSFNQTVTATGRLSSSEPNLQNIPIRTEEGREIRRAFVAAPGYRLLSADYSQIELRIMAHFAGDEALLEAFRRGEDIHRRTAAEVYGVDIKDVTEQMRRTAKTANFAIIYGVSAYGLTQQSEMSLDQARNYIDAYFERYPGVKRYMEKMIKFARQNGYVETLLKRRRYLPDINAQSRQAREFAERTAINTPIQGTAADLIKLAMIRIAANLKERNMKSRMILQVHDELVFEMAMGEEDYLRRMVREKMEGALDLNVPIRVDMKEGDNWLETS